MTFLLLLTLLAALFNGTLAGLSLDTSLVKLPARRRIGNSAYAVFARGNDLGRGKLVYATWAIGAAGLVFITTIAAIIQQRSMEQVLPLLIALATSVVHFGATFKAAPIMLSIAQTPDDEAILRHKFDEFEKWQFVRMVFQVLTAVVMVWALVVVR